MPHQLIILVKLKAFLRKIYWEMFDAKILIFAPCPSLAFCHAKSVNVHP